MRELPEPRFGGDADRFDRDPSVPLAGLSNGSYLVAVKRLR